MDWFNVLYLIIGGVLTAVGGFLTQLYSNISADKKYEKEKIDKEKLVLKEKKEKFFIEVVNAMTSAISERPLKVSTKKALNNLCSSFLLYINQEWFDKYWNMVIDIFETKNTNDFNIKKYEKFYEDLKQVLFDE